MPRSAVLIGVLIASALELVTLPAFGSLSDRIGRHPVIIGGALAMMLIFFPFFWLVHTGNTLLMELGTLRCTSRRPLFEACPVAENCRARVGIRPRSPP